PGEAHAAFNVRYNTGHTRAGLEVMLREHCDRLAAEHGIDRYTLEFSGTGDAFLTEPGPFVDRVAGAVKTVTGRSPALTTSGGTSDARFIQACCPVVEFGLTNATIHAIDERTATADLSALTAIYRRVLDHD
ncbi:MAG: M20/M25/M40 family metallo-hydrolase, partial [Pseudomonadota bacterium]